jgi:hypothetical protein
LLVRYRTFYLGDGKRSSQGGASVFDFGRVTRWFIDMMDARVGRKTLESALRAFHSCAEIFGFEEDVSRNKRLRIFARDWQAANAKEPRRAPPHSIAFLKWMEAYILDLEKPAPRREVIGRHRLRCQASIRHDDMRRTAVSRCAWVGWAPNLIPSTTASGWADPPDPDDGPPLRGLVTRAYATKTVPRHWSASALGVSVQGDGWLQTTFALMKEAHLHPLTDDFMGMAMDHDMTGWIQSPATGADDASHIRRIMEDEGFAEGPIRELRLHSAKCTFTSLGQHLGQPEMAVRIQGGWRGRNESNMPDTYMREGQLVSLKFQEAVLKYLRDGGDMTQLPVLGQCVTTSPPPQRDAADSLPPQGATPSEDLGLPNPPLFEGGGASTEFSPLYSDGQVSPFAIISEHAASTRRGGATPRFTEGPSVPRSPRVDNGDPNAPQPESILGSEEEQFEESEASSCTSDVMDDPSLGSYMVNTTSGKVHMAIEVDDRDVFLKRAAACGPGAFRPACHTYVALADYYECVPTGIGCGRLTWCQRCLVIKQDFDSYSEA